MSENPETTVPEQDPAPTQAEPEQEPTILSGAKAEPGPEPDKAAEPEPGDDNAEPEPAPEWSAEDLKAPDWVSSDERFGKFAETAKEMGLDADSAQKMVDIYVQVREDERKVFNETKARWAEESKKLLGENADEKLAIVAKALDGIDPEVSEKFRYILDKTAIGNHPAVVQVLYELSKQAVGGGFVQGKPARPDKKKSIAEIFYGKE